MVLTMGPPRLGRLALVYSEPDNTQVRIRAGAVGPDYRIFTDAQSGIAGSVSLRTAPRALTS